MSKLWVFGDSFSTPFSHYSQYCEYKGYTPKTYYEIIAEKSNLEIMSLGMGGADNHTILDKIINHLYDIKEEDIIIIGWTDWYRTRVVGNNGQWECLNPGHVNQPTVDISNYSINSIKDIILNRGHQNYIDEMNNIIKLIKYTFRYNKLVDWCWIDENNVLNCEIKHIGRQKTIMEETKRLIWDYHWGEEGHANLADKIYSKLIS
jgi:hypothetical protein